MSSSEPAVSNLADLPPVQHAGERVLTTELLAKVYGVDPKAIQDNHQNHRARFTEGVHFFRLSGEELKEFKRDPDYIGVAPKFASHITLWTERGAARHAKLISTDEAWTVFGRLEDSYFDSAITSAAVAAPKTQAALARDAVDTFKCLREFGELLKLCDRVYCIAHDTLGTCLDRRDFSEERLLLEVN